MKAEIRINKKTGSKCLICYYDANKCDWDEKINIAEKQLGLKGKRITVIALPEGSPVFRRFPPGGRDRGVKLTAS